MLGLRNHLLSTLHIRWSCVIWNYNWSSQRRDSGVRAVTATTLAGMWGGFGLGAYFTRNMAPAERFRADPPPVAIAPITFDEGGAGLSLTGRF